METCLIPCEGWSPWSLMGQCCQVQDLFLCSTHRTVRLASTWVGLLCLQSSPRLPFILWPAEGADQHIPLLPNSCLCVGLLNRHQGQKRSRLSVHGGTKDKGMNKIHPLLPGVAPGLLRLCFPIFSLWDMQKKIIWAHGQIDKVIKAEGSRAGDSGLPKPSWTVTVFRTHRVGSLCLPE